MTFLLCNQQYQSTEGNSKNWLQPMKRTHWPHFCWGLLPTTTTVLRPFFRDHPGELVPEENFWTLYCKGRLTEADTLTIRMDATPSGLTSAHVHHPLFFYRPDALPAAQPTVSKWGLLLVQYSSIHEVIHQCVLDRRKYIFWNVSVLMAAWL